eukprot:TRINITY_DN2853_c0_g1_i2.p1 TRINITY_DN2853_c0_g1~~TRINITY_DN2853_c0_g1_i2.p1  ORF type:complete len:509 (-),score=110.87 TRINITY_DN2853_c0_g1_i2:152-1678(-)
MSTHNKKPARIKSTNPTVLLLARPTSDAEIHATSALLALQEDSKYSTNHHEASYPYAEIVSEIVVPDDDEGGGGKLKTSGNTEITNATTTSASNDVDVHSAASSLQATPPADDHIAITALLPKETLLDLERRIQIVKAHYLEHAMLEVLTNVENTAAAPVPSAAALPPPAAAPSIDRMNPGNNNENGARVGAIPHSSSTPTLAPRTRRRHGSLLDYLGESLRSQSAGDARELTQQQTPAVAPIAAAAPVDDGSTRPRSALTVKEGIENTLRLNEESKEVESRIQESLREVLQRVSVIRPVTEAELIARLRRVEEPFDMLERLLNEHVQLLLEEVSLDSQPSLSNSSSGHASVDRSWVGGGGGGAGASAAPTTRGRRRPSSLDDSKAPSVSMIPETANSSRRLVMALPATPPPANSALLSDHMQAAAVGNAAGSSQKRYPKQVQKILYDWLRTHFDHPYPTKAEKEQIAAAAGITPDQVGQWFTNARRRIWKPFKSSLDVSTKPDSRGG